MWKPLALAAIALGASPLPAQTPPYSLSTQTNLVIVPTQVKTRQGEPLYGLRPNQFLIEDNGVRQRVHLDEATNEVGLSLVVLIQCSETAALELAKMKGLESMVEGIAGAAPYEIATVSYGAGPTLLGNFTSDAAKVASAVSTIKPCRDNGAATLDAVYYAARLLSARQNNYRRAILLVSETRDHGSHSPPQEVIAALGRTNTVVNAVAWSPARDKLVRDLQNRGERRPLNILPLLATSVNAMRRNAPSELATLSGGAYANFETQQGFEQALSHIQNEIHNYYQLSFQSPATPSYGFHALTVSVPDYPDAVVKCRTSYWSGVMQSPKDVP